MLKNVEVCMYVCMYVCIFMYVCISTCLYLRPNCMFRRALGSEIMGYLNEMKRTAHQEQVRRYMS
jgi:hypothetical protein